MNDWIVEAARCSKVPRVREYASAIITRLRERVRALETLRQIATAIGTPDHVDPLADLTGLVMMVEGLVQRAESSAILAAERDRRIDPVEHARAVVAGWCWHWAWEHGRMDASACNADWAASPERAALLARVGPDVLAEVER